jgi:hypothetical protein
VASVLSGEEKGTFWIIAFWPRAGDSNADGGFGLNFCAHRRLRSYLQPTAYRLQSRPDGGWKAAGLRPRLEIGTVLRPRSSDLRTTTCRNPAFLRKSPLEVNPDGTNTWFSHKATKPRR